MYIKHNASTAAIAFSTEAFGDYAGIQVRAKNPDGGLRLYSLPVAASQTIHKGDLLTLSSGTIIIAATPVATTFTACADNTLIYYIAAEDCTTTASVTDANRMLCFAGSEVEIALRVYASGTGSSSEPATLTKGSSYRFGNYGINTPVTQWGWYISGTASTTGGGKYLEDHKDTTNTEYWGPVWVSLTGV